MRILHTMLRVGDLKKSIEFYTGVLGMRVLRQSDYAEGRFTLAFVGYGDGGGLDVARVGVQVFEKHVFMQGIYAFADAVAFVDVINLAF